MTSNLLSSHGFATVSLTGALLFAGAACASSSSSKSDDEKKARNYDSAQSEESSSDDPSSSTESGQSSTSSQSSGRRSRRRGRPPAGGQQTEKSEPPRATGPVAHVDGEPIPAETFNEQIDKVAKTGKFPVSLLHRFKSRLIDRLIDRKLLDQAIADSSVEVSEEEVSKKLEDVRKKFEQQSDGQGKSKSLDQMASEYGISGDELRDSVRRSIAIEKLLVERGTEMPSDDEARKYYEDNKKQFEKPERVRARHIVARVKPESKEKKWKRAEKRIKKIRKKVVDKGKSFADLAKENSDGPRSQKGGDLGYFSKKQLQNKALAEAAFSLDEGEVSKPIKSKFGWHLIKKTGSKEASTTPYEEISDRLKERLKNKKIKEQLQTYLEELRSEAEIEKHPDNVE